ncbi:hypothetical protein BKA66DRAFT_586238 [Pyrenochaeta sp. MPI-SDFR-AT-0127]|nr:hypothetical protein BKA66DRAFT_586238 [Pyrenochaeta sp. MPI-SDFR-AT-0127]
MAGSGKAHRFAAAFALLLLGLFLGICLGQARLGRGSEGICRTIARSLYLAHGCRHISYETISHLRRPYPSGVIEGHRSAKKHDRRDTGRSKRTTGATGGSGRLSAPGNVQPQRRVENRLRVFGILIMCDKTSDFGGCGWLRSSCEGSAEGRRCWTSKGGRATLFAGAQKQAAVVKGCARPQKGIPLWRAANGSRAPAGASASPKCGQDDAERAVGRLLRVFSRGAHAASTATHCCPPSNDAVVDKPVRGGFSELFGSTVAIPASARLPAICARLRVPEHPSVERRAAPGTPDLGRRSSQHRGRVRSVSSCPTGMHHQALLNMTARPPVPACPYPQQLAFLCPQDSELPMP